MEFIKCSNLSYDYVTSDGEKEVTIKALKNINISVKKGEFIALLGHNGSGKSTFGKILNGLITPQKESVFIEGLDVSDYKNIPAIRGKIGMVFQNPDNQLVSAIVEDEVAFGPENLAIEPTEIRKRVDDALKRVGMYEYKDKMVASLSGGQKQKIAVAGILAMKPQCIVFDEATAMLDPKGRKDVVKIACELNKEGITIIFITHNMEESLCADRIFVFNDGDVAIEGTPYEVFSQYEKIKECRLELPKITELGKRLGYKNIFSVEELVGKLLENKLNSVNIENKNYIVDTPSILKAENISYVYSDGKTAVDNVSVEINEGELVCLIGHTGSGKSTFVQLLNRIYNPQEGSIYFKNKNINEIKNIRQKIGLVFQYPEDQIFEANVFDEVAFAPKNLGFSKEEIENKVENALGFVGIDKSYYEKSPMELSGGEKRKIAIAGILAMEPEILVLDEPMAGLDPLGRKEILSNIKAMTSKGITIILVSHSMEEVAEVADRIIVAHKGKFEFFDTAENVFKHTRELINIGLDIPCVANVFHSLKENGVDLPVVYTVEDAEKVLKRSLNK